MRVIRALLVVVAWVGVWLPTQAAPFVNLDFESANTNDSQIVFQYINTMPPAPGWFPFGTGPADQLLPGWTVVIRDNTPTNVVFIGNGYYEQLTGPPLPVPWERGRVGLMIPGRYVFMNFISEPEGKYGLLVKAPARVSQTGDVPTDAQWLVFHMLTLEFPVVLVDGEAYGSWFSNPDALVRDAYNNRYFDISPWAGKTVSIGFTAQGESTLLGIDSIRFISRDAQAPTRLEIEPRRDKVLLKWEGPGKLTASSAIDGVFSPVAGAINPYLVTPEGTVFYRVEQ